MNNITESQAYYRAHRAHIEKELKFLLLPYISSRLFVSFNHKEKGKRKRTFYANEHRVTYSQLLKGYVQEIILNKAAGYNNLVQMVEETLKGKYLSAKIYLRPPGDTEFSILAREYYKDKLVPRDQLAGKDVLTQDHPFEPDDCQVLYYRIEDGKVLISEAPVTQGEDFHALVTEQLK